MNKIALAVGSVLVVFALAMTALAQVDTASTSTVAEEVATTSESIVTDSASTTPIAEELASTIATEVASDIASTTDESTPVPEGTAPVAENAPPMSADVQAVTALEEGYFAKNGRYLQVIPGNKLPEYESGTVAEKLGANIPSGVRVDVYEGPKGFGYSVTYEDKGTIYTAGFGPEAADRTRSFPVPIVVSSSTEAVSESLAAPADAAPDSAAASTTTAPISN